MDEVINFENGKRGHPSPMNSRNVSNQNASLPKTIRSVKETLAQSVRSAQLWA